MPDKRRVRWYEFDDGLSKSMISSAVARLLNWGDIPLGSRGALPLIDDIPMGSEILDATVKDGVLSVLVRHGSFDVIPPGEIPSFWAIRKMHMVMVERGNDGVLRNLDAATLRDTNVSTT